MKEEELPKTTSEIKSRLKELERDLEKGSIFVIEKVKEIAKRDLTEKEVEDLKSALKLYFGFESMLLLLTEKRKEEK